MKPGGTLDLNLHFIMITISSGTAPWRGEEDGPNSGAHARSENARGGGDTGKPIIPGSRKW